jgi:hypothetical protein
MVLKYLISGIGMLALSAIGVAAQAGIMTIGDSSTFNIGSYDGLYDQDAGEDAEGNNVLEQWKETQDITLDRFDNSLGTLLDVSIWFDSAWSLSSTIYAIGPSTGDRVTTAGGRSVSNQRVWLFDPDKAVVANNQVVKSSCNDRPQCTDTTSGSGVFSESFDLSGFLLSDFIGADELDLRVVRVLKSDLTKCGTFEYCSHNNSNNAWAGNVNVEYTYATVPEPSSIALMGMGMGLAGLGVSGLRKRKQ